MSWHRRTIVGDFAFFASVPRLSSVIQRCTSL
jgi:hypothetical protein